MSPANSRPKLSKRQLKGVIRDIVLKQGNHFIKELLRENQIKIGATKEDFERNLATAIEEGALTQEHIEAWLAGVEGWGDQHIYLVTAPTLKHTQLDELLDAPRYQKLRQKAVSYDFPEKLALTAVSLTATHLSMVWHQSKGGWQRVKELDFQQEEGLEHYAYHAFRERFDRSVVRFEWRLSDTFAAILVQLPVEDDSHAEALKLMWADLQKAGIANKALPRIKISTAIKTLSKEADVAATQKARIMNEDGHVEFASTRSDGAGIAAVEAVRQAQLGVDDAKFKTAEGTFNFLQANYAQLSRNIKIHGYGPENRVRIWVQCKREDVYFVIDTIHARLSGDGKEN